MAAWKQFHLACKKLNLKKGQMACWDLRTLDDRKLDVQLQFNGRNLDHHKGLAAYMIHGGEFVAKKNGSLEVKVKNRSWLACSLHFLLVSRD